MKKQDLRVSANNLRSVSGNPDISIAEQALHVPRRRFVSSVDLSSESVDSSGENIIQSHKITAERTSFSDAAAAALLAVPFRSLLSFLRLFLLDSEIFQCSPD